MDETDQNRLTEGSVPRKMLSFALPIFLSNLFQQLYNAVDSLIVGNFIGQRRSGGGGLLRQHDYAAGRVY